MAARRTTPPVGELIETDSSQLASKNLRIEEIPEGEMPGTWAEIPKGIPITNTAIPMGVEIDAIGDRCTFFPNPICGYT